MINQKDIEAIRPEYCKTCNAVPAACERCDHPDRMPEDARELARKVAKSVSDSMHAPIVLDIYGDAVDLIEDHDAAVRAQLANARSALESINELMSWHHEHGDPNTPECTACKVQEIVRSTLDGKETPADKNKKASCTD